MEINTLPTPGTAVGQEPTTKNSRPEGSIQAVFKLILVDAIRDFLSGILGFFQKYARHYRESFAYLWTPSPAGIATEQASWKDHCRATFELSLLALFLIIFMVKLEWIPQSSREIMDMLSNDLHQMGLEVVLFFAFALCYLLFVTLSILTGRLLRVMFELPLSRHQCDILFAYLNNLIFSLTIFPSLLLRFSSSAIVSAENSELLVGLWVVLFLLYLPIVITWSIRFAKKNGLSGKKRMAFVGLTFFPFTLFYSYTGVFLTSLLFNV